MLGLFLFKYPTQPINPLWKDFPLVLYVFFHITFTKCKGAVMHYRNICSIETMFMCHDLIFLNGVALFTPLVSLSPILSGTPSLEIWYLPPPASLPNKWHLLQFLGLSPCLTSENVLVPVEWSWTIPGSDSLLVGWYTPPLVLWSLIVWSFVPLPPDLYPPWNQQTINRTHRKPF